MRRAVLQVVNQSDYMAAMAGDPQNWRTCYSVYACLGSEETRGSDALSGPRDYDKAKKLVAEAGYKGEPVVLLDAADIPQLHAEAAVTADLLQKLGLNVEVATTEWGTVIKRIQSKNPVAQGGWNVFVTAFRGPRHAEPSHDAKPARARSRGGIAGLGGRREAGGAARRVVRGDRRRRHAA
jgi:peptide/nickel transport system substrate-binding protein